MNITTFTVEGPALTARIPLPCPVEHTVSPYPWDEFLDDMRTVLEDHVESPDFEETRAAVLGNLAPDGTCYWIRADVDDGPRFLRVYVAAGEDVALAIETCAQADVPGRLRLN